MGHVKRQCSCSTFSEIGITTLWKFQLKMSNFFPIKFDFAWLQYKYSNIIFQNFNCITLCSSLIYLVKRQNSFCDYWFSNWNFFTSWVTGDPMVVKGLREWDHLWLWRWGHKSWPVWVVVAQVIITHYIAASDRTGLLGTVGILWQTHTDGRTHSVCSNNVHFWYCDLYLLFVVSRSERSILFKISKSLDRLICVCL